MKYFYTALIKDVDTPIEFAEHFEDEIEMRKRAKQLESEARARGGWVAYAGEEPAEAYIVRIGVTTLESETPKEGDTPEVLESKKLAYETRVSALVAKVKTVSKLQPPEVDDTVSPRPLPEIALARSAVEVAEQAFKDAQVSYDTLQATADALTEEATSRTALSASGEVRAELRRKATGAQGEADQAQARLYHAGQNLTAKIKIVEDLQNA